MSRYDFLVETYETERLKTLTVWSQFTDAQLGFRIEPRARTPLEQMVHQCISEDVWMTKMLGLGIDLAPLPPTESRIGFLAHYADASLQRLHLLRQQTEEWYEAPAQFFDTTRSRAWILVRRIAHTSHHRGQLTTILRALSQSLYSTYGPTADTGGLFQHNAPVIYRYADVDELLAAEEAGGETITLPGPGDHPATERPTRES